MTRSELVERISQKIPQLPSRDVENVVKIIIEAFSSALSKKKRIEIRGFGRFSLHYRKPRRGRNPKTGVSLNLTGRYVPHFKPGKELRERVNARLHAKLAGDTGDRK